MRCWNVNGVVNVVPNHLSEVQCNIYCDGNGSTKGIVNINFWISFLTTLINIHILRNYIEYKFEIFYKNLSFSDEKLLPMVYHI